MLLETMNKLIKLSARWKMNREQNVRGAERIMNNITDAEVIELIREIIRLKDCIRTLDNNNAYIIKRNRELQQELRRLTQK